MDCPCRRLKGCRAGAAAQTSAPARQPFSLRQGQSKEKFDLDALRDAAYGRAISGPLKLPTLSRLSSRLVKDFREKLPAAAAAKK